jgi:hypothetical protein
VEAIIKAKYVPRCLQNGILLLIEDPTDFKRGFSKIYKQTFDCAETEVGDSDTATGGIS